jgi:hypothetical protein
MLLLWLYRESALIAEGIVITPQRFDRETPKAASFPGRIAKQMHTHFF